MSISVNTIDCIYIASTGGNLSREGRDPSGTEETLREMYDSTFTNDYYIDLCR